MANYIQTTLNLNETAILGLLADKARYGYELDKIIKERHIREWTDIAFSSIYAILKGLEGKGCVESKAEIAGNRVRRHYSITRQGRKSLRASTALLLSEPAKTSDSLMAGLANVDLLPMEDVKKALTQRAAALKEQLKMIGELGKNRRGKDKAYFEALVARAEGRISEELCFVEIMLGEEPIEAQEAVEAKETVEETLPAASAPEVKESQLTKQPSKGSEERKQTLF